MEEMYRASVEDADGELHDFVFRITWFDPGKPPKIGAYPETSDPGESPEIEYEVMNADGTSADGFWFSLPDSERWRIEDEMIEYVNSILKREAELWRCPC